MGPVQLLAPGPPRYATRGNTPGEPGKTGKRGQTPSQDRLLPDSHTIEPEREVQPMFRKTLFFQLLVLALAVVAFEDWMDGLADREELGPRVAQIHLRPILLPQRAGPLRLAGAWKLISTDPRFGGISALAVDGGQLLAVTDAGALVSFAKPGRTAVLPAMIRELPDGPGDPRFKSSRDAESLARDPASRGWWVGFENRHSVWLFDRQFQRALAKIELGSGRWHRNGGIEGLAPLGRSLLGFPERGDQVVELLPSPERTLPIDGTNGRISDATVLGIGRIAVIRRSPGPLGFSNSLAFLERKGERWRYASRIRLPVSPLDNVEGLAAEKLPGGATRLWMMTDDNFHAPLRTLLLAYDLPPGRQAD